MYKKTCGERDHKFRCIKVSILSLLTQWDARRARILHRARAAIPSVYNARAARQAYRYYTAGRERACSPRRANPRVSVGDVRTGRLKIRESRKEHGWGDNVNV